MMLRAEFLHSHDARAFELIIHPLPVVAVASTLREHDAALSPSELSLRVLVYQGLVGWA